MAYDETCFADAPLKQQMGAIDSTARTGAHILIVDDDAGSRDFMDLVLRNAGYLTARAVDGAEALDMAEQFGPFDLLVTDEMMPRMQGHVLAQRLRQREPWVKILYVTGYSDHLMKAKGTLGDGEALLDKPSTVHGFLETVNLLLECRPAGETH
jgi:CheY-like chemotaxis protein